MVGDNRDCDLKEEDEKSEERRRGVCVIHVP